MDIRSGSFSTDSAPSHHVGYTSIIDHSVDIEGRRQSAIADIVNLLAEQKPVVRGSRKVVGEPQPQSTNPAPRAPA